MELNCVGPKVGRILYRGNQAVFAFSERINVEMVVARQVQRVEWGLNRIEKDELEILFVEIGVGTDNA